jgi:hypothetical protein
MLLAAAALFSTAEIAVAAESTTAMDQVMCAGINACKGQGWVHTSQENCDAKSGTVIEN